MRIWMLLLLLFTSCRSSNSTQLTQRQEIKKRESDYTIECALQLKGRTEVPLADGTRADIVTDSVVYEVDYARKWYEAVGQSLHYARVTGLQPGIILIITKPSDQTYVQRLNLLKKHYKLNLKILTTD